MTGFNFTSEINLFLAEDASNLLNLEKYSEQQWAELLETGAITENLITNGEIVEKQVNKYNNINKEFSLKYENVIYINITIKLSWNFKSCN